MNIADTVLTGLTLGSIYALVAVGFNILFRPTNVFNFAQGDLIMVGALLAATTVTTHHLGWGLGLIVVVLALGLLGAVEERTAVTPVLKKSSTATGWVISTLAVSLIIENVVVKIWGSNPYKVPAPPLLSTRTHIVHGVVLSSYKIALIVGTVIAVVLIERVYRTRTGKAILAIAEDREAAELRGINPRRMSLWSFALGGAFAGVTGLVVAPLLSASTSLGQGLLLNGFEAAAVGGIGDNRGALLAGYLVGLAEAFTAQALAPGYADAVTFGLLLAVLLVKPVGFFGAREARVV